MVVRFIARLDGNPPAVVANSKFTSETFDERQTFTRQRVAGGSQITPNARSGSELRFRMRERLNRQPPAVANLFERKQGASPIDMPLPRNTSIIFGNVHMTDAFGKVPQRFDRILFLNTRLRLEFSPLHFLFL